ncbi:hypothetical protein GCM10007332_30770 [Epilithonimonas arachidiradicis]|uniref:Lipoprotein n=1 Tax=Epilithonimonas arachidiradicis TaxID=1617282 RepID=A0ABQ1X857_9FLAO|nr:hypothetical protein GCM10007332_30770 [Epilithonimonas arachidiradicis]
MQSCKKKENEPINENSIQKKSELKKDSTTFKSLLRLNEKLELGEIYTDTVKFVKFDDNGDDWYFVVKKNNDTVSLIYNTDDPKIIRGAELEIQWKMDSLRPAGDPEYLDFTEYLISWKKLKSKNSERDFSKLKNQSFVLSCGTGCAMTHNVKEIRPINEASIKVTFEVDMYVDGELTETFDETYLFNYGNKNTIKNMKTNENIEKIFTESAQRSFKEFGAKLME